MVGILSMAYFYVSRFIKDEVRRIKEDESGMEVLQVVLIILMVIIIAAALWAFLGDYITNLLAEIANQGEQIKDDITDPSAPQF